MIEDNRCGKKIVHRDIEKTLNLPGMQVHGNDPVRARRGNQVSHQFGADGHPGRHFFILPGVTVIGNHGGHAPGRGPLHGINHQQQFDQVVVDRMTGGLDDEYVPQSHVVV